MALSDKIRTNIGLFKEYCTAFGLKPVTDSKVLQRWAAARGPMLGAAFLNDNVEEAPIAWIALDPDGGLYLEQNEDLLGPNEPAVAEINESLIRIAIDNKKPIHPMD